MTRDTPQPDRGAHADQNQPVLDALLRHRLGGDGPAPDLEQRIRDRIDAAETGSMTTTLSVVQVESERPDARPERRLVLSAIAVAATVLIGVLIGLVVVGTDDHHLPDGVQAGPGADFTLRTDGETVHVELVRGWLIISPGAPEIRVGDEAIRDVTGRVLVSAGEPPDDSHGVTTLQNELLDHGLSTQDLTMVHPATNWLTRTGMAMLVIAGSALINGQTVSAQDAPEALEVPVLLAWHGDDAVATGEYRKLFFSAAQFRTKWAEWFPDREAPTVDFERCMVVAVLDSSTGGFQTVRAVESGTACQLDYRPIPRDADAGDGSGYGLFVLPRLIGAVTIRCIENGRTTNRQTFVTASARVQVGGGGNGNATEEPAPATVPAVSSDKKVILQLPEGTDPQRNDRMIVIRTTNSATGDPIAELIIDSVVGRIAVCDVVWETAPIRKDYRVNAK